MSVDVNKIAQEKIAAMEESGEIEKYIEDKLKNLILDSISSALDGYELRKLIKTKIEKEVAPCVNRLDFKAYNSFICEKFRQITEEYLKEDISKKISDTFENIFMLKRESIKLSEIFEAYRRWLLEDLEENEKYELNNEFYASVKDDTWLECAISKEVPDKLTSFGGSRKDIYSCDFGFTVHKTYGKNGVGRICNVYFEGSSVKDVLKVTSYNDFQSLLLNLYYNETPVILDVENESDIDTSLDLDF